MNSIHTLLFIISFFINYLGVLAQNTPLKEVKQTESKQPYSLFVGVDLFQPILASFKEHRTRYEVFANGRVYKSMYLALEYGMHKDIFNELDWNVNMDGRFYKIGFNYSFNEFEQNRNEAFFIGLRYALSNFNQKVNEYVVRFEDPTLNFISSLPEAKLNASWGEIVIGARVKLIKKVPLYAEMTGKIKVLLHKEKQNGFTPVLIPGYGKNFDVIKFDLNWGLAFEIPIKKKHKYEIVPENLPEEKKELKEELEKRPKKRNLKGILKVKSGKIKKSEKNLESKD